jgi:hypothetical protein
MWGVDARSLLGFRESVFSCGREANTDLTIHNENNIMKHNQIPRKCEYRDSNPESRAHITRFHQ